jgi:bacterioferritin-associated ferredoxin
LLLKTIFNIKMVLCICKAVSDHEVRRAVQDGAHTVAEVMRCTGAGTRCGTCRTELADVVAAAKPPQPCRRRLELLDAYPLHPAVEAA